MSAPASDSRFEDAPINWPAVIMFVLTTGLLLTVFPWYALTFGFETSSWVWFGIVTFATGLSITAGYHRLWSHRAYKANFAMRVFYAAFGAMALQNSILMWGSMHRVHHRHVDDEDQDPYSARRGLWFSHLGWMLRDYPSSKVDFSNARDLLDDPVVAFQHKHYLVIALGMNILFPLAIGALTGDPWGTLVLAGLFRLVMNHHFTFFINSLAHYWGRRPYTDANSARDNDILALVTFGEGYHNFHHLFQWDYRNGIRWWQFDPTKWWIAGWSAVGVTSGLRRTPEFQIRRAMVERQLKQAQEQLATDAGRTHSASRVAQLQKLLEQELQHFSATLAEWARLQQEKFEAAKQQMAEQWETSEVRRRIGALEDALICQHRRVRLLRLQVSRLGPAA